MSIGDDYVTVKQCAVSKGVTKAAVHLAIKEGRIPSENVGGVLLIKKADCEAYQPLSHKEAGEKGAAKRRQVKFEETMAYVLEKNKELYERLAKPKEEGED